MFLTENLKKEYFDEFNPSFSFLVSQYSALLSNPELYTINEDSNEVILSETKL